MLRATWLRGRRGAVIGASAAFVCLGGLVASCAGGDVDGGGYVAVGPAGGTPVASGRAVAPTADVTLVPLDRTRSAHSGQVSSGADTGRSSAPGGHADNSPAQSGGSAVAHETGGTPDRVGPSPTGTDSGRTDTGSPSPAPTGPRPTPGGPAALSLGEPVREATDQRWCEKVTVPLHNTGGSAVRSGTVTFGTHIIGAIGIDWATIESTDTLPAPIAAGASVNKTWTVCVDAWRVPPGMHIETRDVSVRWE